MNRLFIWRAFLIAITLIGANCHLAYCQTDQSVPSFEHAQYVLGALVRMDTTLPKAYLVFTGHEFSDGGTFIRKRLKAKNVPAHFFFYGRFLSQSPTCQADPKAPKTRALSRSTL